MYLTLRTGVRLAYVSYVYEILYLLTISPPTPTSSSYSLSIYLYLSFTFLLPFLPIPPPHTPFSHFRNIHLFSVSPTKYSANPRLVLHCLVMCKDEMYRKGGRWRMIASCHPSILLPLPSCCVK